jgi:hypothetical protein
MKSGRQMTPCNGLFITLKQKITKQRIKQFRNGQETISETWRRVFFPIENILLSACKDGSGMRFLLCGGADNQMAVRPRRFTLHKKGSPLLETSNKNYCLQTEQNMGFQLAAYNPQITYLNLQPDPSRR